MPRDKQLHVTRVNLRARAQDLTGIDRSIASSSWPVGVIFTSTVATNPSILLGFGLWELYAQGRVLVGVDPTQTEFDTLGETGGEKTHALTCGETPDC